MKFTVQQKNLITALNTCQKAIGNGLVIATGCYRFTLVKQLTITACNMQVSISTQIDANGSKCDLLIPGHVKAWVASLAEQPLTFHIEPIEEDYNVTIKSDSGNCEFIGYNASDFPVINTDAGSAATLPFEDITEALYHTSYSKLSDNTANVLNFVSLELGDGAVFAAFNGVIFAKFFLGGRYAEMNLLLPDALISALSGLFAVGECSMVYSERNISFTIGDIEVKSTLGDGKYIAYKHGLVVPSNNVTVNRSELVSAIKRVLMFSNKIDQLVRVKFGDDGLLITGSDEDMKNKATESVSGSCEIELLIGINGNMTIEALSHLPSELVVISYSTHTKPLFFHTDLSVDSFSMIAPIMLKENL